MLVPEDPETYCVARGPTSLGSRADQMGWFVSRTQTREGGITRGEHGAVTPASSGPPAWRGPLVTAIGVTVVGIVAVIYLNGNFNDAEFVLAVCSGIVIVGMVVQVGFAHQLAFSQSVFMGFGAYGVAILNTKYGWSVPLAVVVVTVAAALIAAPLGAVATRAPGFTLALATLLFPTIVTGFVVYSNYLGGTSGIGGIQALWSGASYSATLVRSGVIGVVVLGLCVFVCGRIMQSGIGLEIALMGASGRAAGSVGVIARRRRLELFMFGSALSALGGAIYAGTQAFVSYTNFADVEELILLVMLFIGGRAYILGGLIGAVGIQYLSGTYNFVDINLAIFEGVLLTVVLLFAPGGLFELVLRLGRFLYRTATGGGRAPVVAALASDGRGLGTAAILSKGGTGDGLPEEDTGDSASVGQALGRSEHTVGGMRDLPASFSARGIEVPEVVCRNLTKRFGGVVAVDSVSLEISGVGVHAVCGPNGAGKTTLFELIAGGLEADAGEVWVDGVDVSRKAAFERAQLGVSRTLQSVRLMNNRTVLDNVAVAALLSHRTFLPRAIWRSDLKEAHARALKALERVGIAEMASFRPGQLTLAGQRLTELARAIVSQPKVLLLDEPASGLSIEQRGHLADTLTELGGEMTVVLVEHDLQLVRDIAVEVFVLVDGRLRFSGDAEGFAESPVVRAELMGLG